MSRRLRLQHCQALAAAHVTPQYPCRGQSATGHVITRFALTFLGQAEKRISASPSKAELLLQKVLFLVALGLT